MGENVGSALAALLIPLAGTSIGSAMVFLLRKDLPTWTEKAMLGFTSGVMMAASVWSLLLPSISMAQQQGETAWKPAAIGFLFGMAFLLALDSLIPHLHRNSNQTEGIPAKLRRTTMLIFAVALHNLPEGMAVGVTFAGAVLGHSGITLAGAVTLAAGIAIQNFPEGAIISLPLAKEGMPKARAFVYGVLSGVVEPIGAIATILLAKHVVSILPYLLAFAAGAMVYVVVEELIPESQTGSHSNIGTIGVAIGFVLMMVLDIALG